MAEADGFFSRWSQRKAAVSKGQVVPEPVPVAKADTTAALEPAALAAGTLPPQPSLEARGNEQPQPVASEAPPLTLADADALTPSSDFKPFMQRGVSTEVKNAAMKKLFADPHFNVMDGLDTYIEDYSKPDPIPAAMLRQMVSAKFLKLFDEQKDKDNREEDCKTDELSAAGTPGLAGDDADTQAAVNLPESASVNTEPTSQPNVRGH